MYIQGDESPVQRGFVFRMPAFNGRDSRELSESKNVQTCVLHPFRSFFFYALCMRVCVCVIAHTAVLFDATDGNDTNWDTEKEIKERPEIE